MFHRGGKFLFQKAKLFCEPSQRQLNLQEYQSKELLKKNGCTVQSFFLVNSRQSRIKKQCEYLLGLLRTEFFCGRGLRTRTGLCVRGRGRGLRRGQANEGKNFRKFIIYSHSFHIVVQKELLFSVLTTQFVSCGLRNPPGVENSTLPPVNSEIFEPVEGAMNFDFPKLDSPVLQNAFSSNQIYLECHDSKRLFNVHTSKTSS